ncbi:uncharacterized protein LOC124229382 isoform X2 [Equus quagga]|uniref:uncharacterized protein LOC124229382 isoform X2 n=1 Tax=Equus quagga TaxID=89248 RepID=UPI001EE17AF6|nr:uncharacterized protein LOC124229382 isoform X2 [Equus quagga]
MVMSPPLHSAEGLSTPARCRQSSGQSHPPARRRRERHREVENFSGTPKTGEHCLLSPPRSTRTGAQLRAIRLLWRRWSEFAEVKDPRVCQLTGRGVICGEKMGSSTLSSAAEDHGGLHGGLLKLLLERRHAHLHTSVMNNGTLPGADWHRDGNQTDARGPCPVRQELWSHTRGMNVMASLGGAGHPSPRPGHMIRSGQDYSILVPCPQ